MLLAPKPENETVRVAALRELDVLDSGPEAEFDALVRTASRVCGVPISLINLIDTERHWFKAKVGLPGMDETPRNVGFCSHTILNDGLLEVADASKDRRFYDNPLVTGSPNVRFYAGVPLILSGGERMGTLCVLDSEPRELDNTQRQIIQNLATVAARALEGRKAKHATRHYAAMLAQTQERLRMATESGGIGIWNMDLLSGWLHWDEQVYRLYGMAPSEERLNYLSWAQNVHPDDFPEAARSFEAGIQSSATFSSQYRVIWPNGQVRHLRALGRVEYDTIGRAHRVAGTNWDVTDAVERTLALQAALARADDASRAKEEFMANMNHEIRTPLNAILGLSSLVLESELTTHQRKHLEKIQDAGAMLLDILNAILDHATIQAGRMSLESIELDMADVIDKCRATFAIQAEQKKLSLKFKVKPEVPKKLQGDPLRMLQVLNNLVGNAIKFTPSGQVRVQVQCVEQTQESTLLKVEVSDTGIGMDAHALEHLFGAFHQTDASSTRQYGGAGLGLRISKDLVGLMGGEIGVQSLSGKGCTVTFTARLKTWTKIPGLEGVSEAAGEQLPVAQSPAECARTEAFPSYDNVHPKLLVPQLHELSQLLANGLTRAKPVSKAIEEQLSDTPLLSTFSPVTQAVGRFDFEKALGLLRAWSEQQGWKLP